MIVGFFISLITVKVNKMNRWDEFKFSLTLYSLAVEGLRDANKGNPFISKADAMRFINQFKA